MVLLYCNDTVFRHLKLICLFAFSLFGQNQHNTKQQKQCQCVRFFLLNKFKQFFYTQSKNCYFLQCAISPYHYLNCMTDLYTSQENLRLSLCFCIFPISTAAKRGNQGHRYEDVGEKELSVSQTHNIQRNGAQRGKTL